VNVRSVLGDILVAALAGLAAAVVAAFVTGLAV